MVVALDRTTYEVVRASTSAAAQFLKREQGFGSVAVGRRADLSLLDSNPLTNIDNVGPQVGVMVRGAWRAPAVLRLA